MSETPKINIPDTPKNKKDPNKIPEWHQQQELILKRWSEIGSSYRYLHDKSFKKFDRQNMWFALPVIVISTVTGTANFAQGSFPDAWKEFVPLGIGFFNLSAGLITTVAQFLRVSELLEGHRAASLAYSKFSRNISVELSLPVKERTEDGSVFIANCRTELDRLIEQSPDIPEDIVAAFVKRFPEPERDLSGNTTKSGYEFFRPEILDIKPIKIYRDNAAEEKRKLKAERALAKKEALEKEVALKKLMDQKDAERKSLLDQAKKEFEDSQKKRDNEVKQMLELAQKQTKKELIKNKFSVTNIEESMNELLGSLNQTAQAISDYSDSSSDSDNNEDKPSTPTVLFKSTKPNIEIIIDETSKEDTDTVIDVSGNTDTSGNDV